LRRLPDEAKLSWKWYRTQRHFDAIHGANWEGRMKQPGGAVVEVIEHAGAPANAPEYLRLYRRVRGAILDGALPAGSRLPSSRTLARELAVSRNTVEAALGQLRAEGFLVRRVGSGSYVASELPDAPRRPERFRRADPPTAREPAPVRPAALSVRGMLTVGSGALTDTLNDLVFGPSARAMRELPLEGWRRRASRHARRLAPELLLPGDPAGYRPLREAIAAHLGATRGVRCGWEQVVVVPSIQQAIALTAQLLLDPGDAVWMEEPGYPAARAALRAAGGRVVPVPVDDDGVDVAAGVRLAPRARLAYVTPSHQYPLGPTLTLSRRVALLGWARDADAWIFEDDYDSEFRYAGRPLAAMQGLDSTGRVIYAGTFNKVIFHALRVAYLVLPAELVEAYTLARTLSDGFVPTLSQAVLADFLADGHFAVLLRRVREMYRERRDAFVGATRAVWGEEAVLGPLEAGLHATLVPPGLGDDAAVSDAAAAAGLSVPALSRYFAVPPGRSALLVHYANALPADIRRGVELIEREMRIGASARGA
jgi:GntR family transcriptional regulator / MocR family aminotransferase